MLVCAPQNGLTPLLVAAGVGDLNVVRSLMEAGADITAKTEKVSGRSVGDGGLGTRSRRDFGEGWQPWREILEDLPEMDDCLLAPTNDGVLTMHTTLCCRFR